jgi:hypothetical protein
VGGEVCARDLSRYRRCWAESESVPHSMASSRICGRRRPDNPRLRQAIRVAGLQTWILRRHRANSPGTLMAETRSSSRIPRVHRPLSAPVWGLTERRLCRAEQLDLYALRPRWHGCLLARMHVSAFSSCGPNVVPDRAPGSVGLYEQPVRHARLGSSSGTMREGKASGRCSEGHFRRSQRLPSGSISTVIRLSP